MQVGTSEESSSSDTESEEERPDSEDVHNGNKNKDMSEHTYKGLSSGERKTADTPLVVRHMSPILNWLCIVLIWISLKYQMTNRAICGLMC